MLNSTIEDRNCGCGRSTCSHSSNCNCAQNNSCNYTCNNICLLALNTPKQSLN